MSTNNQINQERTFILVKSDGVQRRLIGVVLKRFENKGLKLIAAKLLIPSKEHFEEHYIEHRNKYFFSKLIQSMLLGPVFAMVLEGTNAVKTGRLLLGETFPENSKPGTIRGDLSIELRRSVVHASDSIESAEREINLWFKPYEIINYKNNIEI